ncbi:hypothetical protein DESAMIL20_1057 [Desulfurella amilsii]|uniref:Uncharacterized protein n=1 Tax=Desulfurella amilsii TaxID=1562698 RepID=A0A1X4XVF1_9BACT|nr:hypothetical protein [Desulfurella amilsii]OSS41504.1 hypothetical protein DESAMIL20_1057 [Desulfurella amilsii]
MPFGDGRGPIWAYHTERYGYGREVGYSRGLGYGRGFGCRWNLSLDSTYEKEYLEEEKRILERRIKDLEVLLSSRKTDAQNV